MLIKDKIFGKVKINEPVLLELLKSPPILRLKSISQFGVPDKYYHIKNFNRYEHSMGVMILLRKLGATPEEQIAGLLHDVSVLAFSHVADWLFGKGREGIEDYHDSIHERFIRNTNIPKILKKHGFALKRLLDENNFPLLEKSAPDLCADRVEYALREFKHWLNSSIIKGCVKSLVNYNGEIVFSDQKPAFDFAINYLELQTQHWGGYEAMMRYHLLSNAFKIAIDKEFLSENDFYRDEKFVMDKVEKIGDKEIQETLRILKNKKLRKIKNNFGQRVIKKFRYVDPKIIIGGELTRLSILSPKFLKILDKHRKINKKGLLV